MLCYPVCYNREVPLDFVINAGAIKCCLNESVLGYNSQVALLPP